MGADLSGDDLILEKIASCGANNCPTVYSSNRRTMVIQGYPVAAATAGIDLPDGEFLVEIPENILLEAAARYAAREA